MGFKHIFFEHFQKKWGNSKKDQSFRKYVTHFFTGSDFLKLLENTLKKSASTRWKRGFFYSTFLIAKWFLKITSGELQTKTTPRSKSDLSKNPLNRLETAFFSTKFDLFLSCITFFENNFFGNERLVSCESR